MSGIRGDSAAPEVIDRAGEGTPVGSEDGPVRAVLDGEIYNRSRLRTLPAGRGGGLRSDSDGELVARLYEEYGEGMLSAIEGRFALAAWDAGERCLFLARDRFGEKPLYYTERSDGSISFASDLSALADPAEYDFALDPVEVDRYFARGHVSGGSVIVAGVRQLPPGHLLDWRPGGPPQVRPYWSPPAPTESNAEAQAHLAAELRRVLTESVRSRLGDGPGGVVLDGGVGAAVLAAVATEVAGAAFETFDVGTDGREVAARVPSLLAALDQPFGDPSAAILWALAAAGEESLDFTLDPQGAVELFGGHARRTTPPRGGEGVRALYGPRLVDAADQGVEPAPELDEFDRLASGAVALTTLAAREASPAGRAPYLDYEVAEFAATVPPELHAAGGGERLLRMLLEQSAPKIPRLRADGVDRVPVGEWLRGPLAPTLRDQLDGAAVADGWLDRSALAPLVDRHLAGTADESAALWPVLAFGLWLDRVRGRDPGA
jgi:asparagine synthetase B (glutamine-hydrolysing)